MLNYNKFKNMINRSFIYVYLIIKCKYVNIKLT